MATASPGVSLSLDSAMGQHLGSPLLKQELRNSCRGPSGCLLLHPISGSPECGKTTVWAVGTGDSGNQFLKWQNLSVTFLALPWGPEPAPRHSPASSAPGPLPGAMSEHRAAVPGERDVAPWPGPARGPQSMNQSQAHFAFLGAGRRRGRSLACPFLPHSLCTQCSEVSC